MTAPLARVSRWLASITVAWLASAGMIGASAADAGRATGPAALPAGAVVLDHVGATPRLAAIVSPVREFRPDPALAALGRRMFFDSGLSRPAGTSCAACHDPARGWGGGRTGPAGVPLGSRPGHASGRVAPSLAYARYVPPLHFYQDDDALAPAPFGGLTADGRADALARQAALPLLNPDEMNHRDGRDVAAALARAPYAGELAARFGPAALRDGKAALDAAGAALEAFLQSDELAPFSSRYDEHVRGRATLTAQELRGLALFRDPDKGNCASCHQFSHSSTNPARSLFTDFGYDAIGVPRNRALAGKGHDLGLCVTARQRGWPEPQAWCGWFRTPSLRNVALRERFMHNGVFDDLREVLRFYATRATAPQDWYPYRVADRVATPAAHAATAVRAGAKEGGAGVTGVAPFDDLPPALRGNVNVNSVPYNRRPGSAPALDDADIDALLAFLRTLSDRPSGLTRP
ncbi:cytochrome-c peroxidase [Derxia gummosa]|uniref:Cytochrome-c peroxidase n=1 Tax=Derxia gummosa DSM 723 TaxID=1121388 RepID=A0A9U5C6H7_9BURK|nr:cytochrome c peroxidase [Derxia gummosa]